MILQQHDAALYQQLANVLRDQIRQGRWAEKEPMPSERELCKLHGVGLMTVRRAMQMLRDEGLITTARGHRATVRTSAERTIVPLQKGGRLIARMPTAAEREELSLEPGIPLLELRQPDGTVQLVPAHDVEVHCSRPPELSR